MCLRARRGPLPLLTCTLCDQEYLPGDHHLEISEELKRAFWISHNHPGAFPGTAHPICDESHPVTVQRRSPFGYRSVVADSSLESKSDCYLQVILSAMAGGIRQFWRCSRCGFEQQFFPCFLGVTVPVSDDLEYYLYDSFYRHLRHLAAARSDVSSNAEVVALLTRVYKAFTRGLPAVVSKVRQTQKDGGMHSWTETSPDLDVHIEVTVHPGSVEQVKSQLQVQTPPGYGGFVNNLLKAPPARLATELGYSAMAHFIICTSICGTHIQLCLTPLSASRSAGCPLMLLPEDLLSEEDRECFGLPVITTDTDKPRV